MIPLTINCTDCYQSMRIELQVISHMRDEQIVAAECRCGRIMGAINGTDISRRRESLVRADIKPDGDIAKWEASTILHCRERINEAERVIAAATWANGGKTS